MKRIFFVFLCLILALASSCKKTADESIKDFFNQTVVFETMGIKYEYNSQIDKFTVLSGDYSGMEMYFTDTDCKVNFEDFSISTDPFSFPQLKLFYSLFRVYEDNFDTAVKNDDGAYALLIDSFRFLVYYNPVAEKVDKLVAETENGSFEYKVITSEE
ncbi:MAG: hypothetical protein J6Q24_05960 [Clostridia bacterium]|nr:hypothetical protein [Clostridia bacterium]